tara:strand:+ start:760 stop:1083 length:324 start_codon:yes stop_codon:yes gene_type:complete
VKELLRVLLPLLVWLASFSAIYGLHGLGCASGWTEVALPVMSLFRWVLFLAWTATIFFQLLLLLALRTQRFGTTSSFIRRLSITNSWTALIATFWTLYPIAVSSTCG